jgi:co-chaperonin GroES (HSP10)
MSFKGQCLGSNVIVEPIENVQLSKGGVDLTHLIDKNQKWGKGIVISIGEKVPLDKEGIPYIQIGDTVLFDRNKATDYVEETTEYKAMYYDDIFKKF